MVGVEEARLKPLRAEARPIPRLTTTRVAIEPPRRVNVHIRPQVIESNTNAIPLTAPLEGQEQGAALRLVGALSVSSRSHDYSRQGWGSARLAAMADRRVREDH